MLDCEDKEDDEDDDEDEDVASGRGVEGCFLVPVGVLAGVTRLRVTSFGTGFCVACLVGVTKEGDFFVVVDGGRARCHATAGGAFFPTPPPPAPDALTFFKYGFTIGMMSCMYGKESLHRPPTFDEPTRDNDKTRCVFACVAPSQYQNVPTFTYEQVRMDIT